MRRDSTRPLLHAFINEFPWIHLSLGLAGNTCFVVGSVLFLFEPLKHAGTWLFVVGSAGMLLGSLGNALIQSERR